MFVYADKIRVIKSIMKAIKKQRYDNPELNEYFRNELREAITWLITGEAASEEFVDFILNYKEVNMTSND